MPFPMPRTEPERSAPMKEACYTLGVDFGTLSARAVLARVADGAVIASAAMEA